MHPIHGVLVLVELMYLENLGESLAHGDTVKISADGVVSLLSYHVGSHRAVDSVV